MFAPLATSGRPVIRPAVGLQIEFNVDEGMVKKLLAGLGAVVPFAPVTVMRVRAGSLVTDRARVRLLLCRFSAQLPFIRTGI